MCGTLTAEDARGCPFCAGLSEVEKIEEGCFGIGCPDCDFQLMSGAVGIGWHESEHEAVVAWNERAHDMALQGANNAWKSAERKLADAQAEIARLRGALEKYEAVREDMFGHFCSNGLFNAWGKEFNCSGLNDVHLLAKAALKK